MTFDGPSRSFVEVRYAMHKVFSALAGEAFALRRPKLDTGRDA
jgi:hypothetical protein